MSIAVSGVNSDARATIVHPAASAAAHARAGLYAGKFHAVMTPTTPIGCRSTVIRFPAVRDGIVRPYARFPSSANHSNRSAATNHSPFPCGNGFPLSSTVVRPSASARSRMRPAAFMRMAARS